MVSNSDLIGRKPWPHGRSRLLLTTAVVALTVSGPAGAESLREALAAAYQYNPRIDAERARLRATDEEIARANSNYRPTITGQAFASRIETNIDPDTPPGSPPGTPSRDSLNKPYGYSINAIQPVFRGFRTVSQVSEAEALVRAGRETLRIAEQSVLLDAATAYMDVVRDQAIVRLRENNSTVLARELKATQDRFDVGEVTRTDVAQAQARRAGTVSALDLARANLKTSRATFERVVGHPPNSLREQPPHHKLIPKSLREAIDIATRDNPNVVAALYREQSSRHTVDRIRGELLPTVQLEANYAHTHNVNRTIDLQEVTTLTARATMPLYSSGEIEARVRQAKHTHVSRLQEIEQFRGEVQAAVTAAWAQHEAARAQLVSDQAQVQANRTALNGVREEEKVGQRTLLDVLNAEQELLNAEVNLVGTQRNVVVASYNVLSTVGRLNVVDLAVVGSAYDPEAHYHETRRRWWGISITHADGRHEFFDFWPQRGHIAPGSGPHAPVK